MKKTIVQLAVMSIGLLASVLPAAEPVAANAAAPVTITVTGQVYETEGPGDAPADQRKGVAGVIVSDGTLLTRTDAAGRYTLADVNPADSAFMVNPAYGGFVFVVTPSGYRHIDSHFRKIPREGGAGSCDFALRAAPETAQPDFAFLQMNDTHLWGEDNAPPLLTTMTQAKALNAAFAIVAGDMLWSGGREDLVKFYGEIMRRTPLPFVSVMGNHDSDPLHRVADVMGPDCYAFDYGGRHFVVLDSNQIYVRQNQWLEKELALQPPNKEVIVFQHHPPSAWLIQLLSRYNTRAVFHGHWHTSRVLKQGNILVVSTPAIRPGRFGALDLSPFQGRLVTFHGNVMELDDIFTGLGTRTTWTAAINRPEPVKDAAVPAPGQDWPMLLHDPAHSGVTVDKVKPPLQLAWRQKLEGSLLLSSPVVANGTVYCGVGDEEFRGRAGIYALEAATGAVKWRYPTATSIKHTVSVANGLVFAATVDGMLFAVEAKDGQLKWQYQLGQPLERWVFAAPLVLDNVVYGGSAPLFVALDALSGQLLWQAKPMGTDWITCLASPVAGDGNVFVCFNKGDGTNKGLYALEAKTGAALWESANFGYTHSTPTFADHTVLAVGKEAVFALAADTGAVKWQFPISGSSVASPVMVGSTVVIADADGKIYGLDAKSGVQRWMHEYGKALGADPASCLLLWTNEKARLSKYWAPPVFLGSPAVSGQIAYLGTVDGYFMALDTETGAELWGADLGAPIAASAAISGNAVYVATYDGTLYAFTSGP